MATTLTLRVGNPTPLTNLQVDNNFTSLKDEKIERDGSIPMTGKLTMVAPSASRANMRVSEGAADPSSPAIGDIWNNSGILKFRKTGSNTYNIITSETGQTFAGDVTIGGSLTVNGATTTINSTTVSVDDKNIVLGDTGAPTDVTADGGGITLQGATAKTLNWVQSTGSWTLSENVDIATGKTFKINGVNVLSSTALGSSVVSSSLTSVGTLASLTVTNPITGSVTGNAGTATALTNALTLGTGLTGTSFTGSAAVTATVDSTPNSTANKVVSRDGSGRSSFKSVYIDGTASGTITIAGSNTGIAGTWELRLPTSAGSANQVLTTDGTGGTSWALVTSVGTLSVGGTISAADNVISRPRFTDYAETYTTPAIISNALTLNLENGNVFRVSRSANITAITISNPPASGNAGSFTLIFDANGTGYTITWPASVKWPGGIVGPTITTTAGRSDMFVFYTNTAGATWYGMIASQNFVTTT